MISYSSQQDFYSITSQIRYCNSDVVYARVKGQMTLYQFPPLRLNCLIAYNLNLETILIRAYRRLFFSCKFATEFTALFIQYDVVKSCFCSSIAVFLEACLPGQQGTLRLDRVEMTLLPNLCPIPKQHPRDGQQQKRQEPKEARRPMNAKSVVHYKYF